MRNVWKRRARYIITYRGRPVGLLTPLEPAEPQKALPLPESAAAIWDELTRLGQEISREWPAGVTSAEVLAEMRR